jgi:hypothetical protein
MSGSPVVAREPKVCCGWIRAQLRRIIHKPRARDEDAGDEESDEDHRQRQSGTGREGGNEGIAEYLDTKYVAISL